VGIVYNFLIPRKETSTNSTHIITAPNTHTNHNRKEQTRASNGSEQVNFYSLATAEERIVFVVVFLRADSRTDENQFGKDATEIQSWINNESHTMSNATW
jgi:hypothetical protein